MNANMGTARIENTSMKIRDSERSRDPGTWLEYAIVWIIRTANMANPRRNSTSGTHTLGGFLLSFIQISTPYATFPFKCNEIGVLLKFVWFFLRCSFTRNTLWILLWGISVRIFFVEESCPLWGYFLHRRYGTNRKLPLIYFLGDSSYLPLFELSHQVWIPASCFILSLVRRLFFIFHEKVISGFYSVFAQQTFIRVLYYR
jgi:hypothetical protein